MPLQPQNFWTLHSCIRDRSKTVRQILEAYEPAEENIAVTNWPGLLAILLEQVLQLGSPALRTQRWKAPAVQVGPWESVTCSEAANVAAPPQAVTASAGLSKVFQDLELQLLRQLLKIQKQLKPRNESAAWSSPRVSTHASVFCSFWADGARLDTWQNDGQR